MTAPPAKRQKRLVVLSSSPERDDDDAPAKHGAGSRDDSGNPQPRRELSLRTRARTRQETNTPAEGKKASPKKQQTRTKPTRKATTNRSISNFLTAAIERQTSVRAEATDVDELEDDIQDGLTGGDKTEEVVKDAKPITRTRRRKEDDDGADHSAAGSQKFLSDTNRSRQSTQEPSADFFRPRTVEGLRPWVDKYAPTLLDEIAVHPKKVDDVRQWILNTFAGRSHKVCF